MCVCVRFQPRKQKSFWFQKMGYKHFCFVRGHTGCSKSVRDHVVLVAARTLISQIFVPHRLSIFMLFRFLRFSLWTLQSAVWKQRFQRMLLETLAHACLILVHEFPKLPSLHLTLSPTPTRFCLHMVLICQGLRWPALVPQFGFSFRSQIRVSSSIPGPL